MKTQSQKILEIKNYFPNHPLIGDLVRAYLESDNSKFESLVEEITQDKKLLENLMKILEGKSVEKNLKKIFKNENVELLDKRIALSSLYTHTCIEAKKDSKYNYLASQILEKLNELR